jgi:signal transduction histidine kinase
VRVDVVGDRVGGTGLGLALVNELTESMNGSVQATSTPGEGSGFAIIPPSSPSQVRVRT